MAFCRRKGDSGCTYKVFETVKKDGAYYERAWFCSL